LVNTASCVHCNREISVDDKFCLHCGAAVAPKDAAATTRLCSSCRQEIGASDRFCRHCGASSMAVVAPSMTANADSA
jgi:predicted amidophosphoribosyltransferase